jgi:hypothetical protein
MPTLEREDYDDWMRCKRLVNEHGTALYAALQQRREYFVEAATDAMRAHKAGALSEPAPEGSILLMDNRGLRQAALMFKEQAERTVLAQKALARADDIHGDVYDIEWEVEW